MPVNRNDPDFDLPEGLVPGGPADETTGDRPQEYFGFDNDDEGDELPGMVPGPIDDGPDKVPPVTRPAKPKSRMPFIGAAVTCLVAATAGGGYWYVNREDIKQTEPEVAKKSNDTVTPADPPVVVPVDTVPDIISKTTSELMKVPFTDVAVAQGEAAQSLEELLRRIEDSEVDSSDCESFLQWREEHAEEIEKDEKLKERVDNCVEWLRKLFPIEATKSSADVPVSTRRSSKHAGVKRGNSGTIFRQQIQAVFAAVTSPDTLLSIVVVPDETKESSERAVFDDDSLPLRKRLLSADKLVEMLRTTNPKSAANVCATAINLLREELNRKNAESSDILQQYNDSLDGSAVRSKLQQHRDLKRKAIAVLLDQELAYLQRRAELLAPAPLPQSASLTVENVKLELTKIGFSSEALETQMLRGSASVGSQREFERVRDVVKSAASGMQLRTDGKTDDTALSEADSALVTRHLETIRQGWSELMLRIQIAKSMEELNLPPALFNLATEQDVEQLAQPQIGDQATPSETDEFNAARRSVGMARVEVERILEKKPAGSFLTTADAANLMSQLQVIRTGWSEMRLMTLMVANRPKAGLTPSEVLVTLAALEIPDGAAADLLPTGVDQSQKDEFDKARELVKSTKETILEVLQGKSVEDPLPIDVVPQLMTKIEQFRSAYFQLQATRLARGGSGGTSYVYAEANTVAAFRAALNGFGIPENPNSLELKYATAEEQREFAEKVASLAKSRADFLAQLADKPDDEELSPEIAARLTSDLETLRIAIVHIQVRVMNSEFPRSSTSEMTVATARAVIEGLGDLDSIKLSPMASPELTGDFEIVRTSAESAVSNIAQSLKGLTDNQVIPADKIADVSKQIEIARQGVSTLRTYVLLSGLPSTSSVVITTVTTPDGVHAVLNGLGLPKVLESLVLAANASEPENAGFASVKTRVTESLAQIENLLQGQAAEDVLPDSSLNQITTSLETIRFGLVELAARVAVSNLDPGSAPGPTLTRQRLQEFLAALGLPLRLDQLRPPKSRPEAVADAQYKNHQTDWNALNSDVDGLKKLAALNDPANSEPLSGAEIQDATTRMDRVLMNLLKLETASQIAALRFPAGTQSPDGQVGSSGQHVAQMPLNATCVPSWVTTDDELCKVIAQLRQEMHQATIAGDVFSPGVTVQQVHQVVFEQAEVIREEFQKVIGQALLQPRTLVPEQLETVGESTAARVLDILSEKSLPPFTLPPDPDQSSGTGSGLEYDKADSEFRQGFALYFSNSPEANMKGMNHFSSAAKFNPRKPTYRYFLALALRRNGQSVEAARQARIGASLEFPRDRAEVSATLERVQGDPRTWLERLRVSP